MKEIHRLLGSWPSQATGDGEEQLRSYLLAAEDYPAGDVEAACTALIKGVAPGVNPNFLPPPAAFGAECRRQLNLRLDHEARNKPKHTALPAPEISEAERERVKAGFAALVADLGANLQTDDAAAVARRKALLSKGNARFAPDMSEDAIARRLGFSVGDEIGHEDAA